MSITKENELEFERVFPSYGDRNDSHTLVFNRDGLEIDYDTLTWVDIKAAYKKLFNTEIDQ